MTLFSPTQNKWQGEKRATDLHPYILTPLCRLLMGQRAFYFRGPWEWNGLPDNIKNTKEIDIFKRTLFNIMFHTKYFWMHFE